MKVNASSLRVKRTRTRSGSILNAPSLPYLVSFFVPILVMLIVFAGNEIYPFGDRSFLRTDLYHQYAPFFQEYKDKLSSFDSLFYTWDIGLGTNFMALYAYYLSSPLNWLLILCPRSLVIEFITYGIVLRMALSSLTMTYYLNKHNETNSLGSSFFGIFYGLSGYMAAYSWNIMWLDCLFLFPLIILGLEQLVKKDRCMLYCVTLAFCIYSNYYISIMVCISLVLYFAVQLILMRGDDYNYPKKVLNFGLYSLLAGGLAAVMLFPEIAALSTTASGNFNFPDGAKSYFSMFDMLSRHLINVNVEIGLDHWPNIYCGVAILLFVPLYLISKKVPFREKLAYGLLLLFFLLSFSLDVLNFIWHGFHYPNSLPCRQSFIYIFLLLSIGFQGYRDIPSRTTKELIKCLCLAAGFVILAEKLGAEYTGTEKDMEDKYYIWYTFYLSLAFLAVYGGLLQVWITRKRKWRGLLFVSALAVVVVESSINMAYTSVTTVSRSNYVKDDESVRNIVSTLEEKNGNDFFRVEKVSNRTKNDGAWLDYHSASIFSSTAYADLTAFYKKLGLESSTNAYGTNGSSWASNMLLGIQYSLSFSELTDDNFRKQIYVVDDAYMYENTYALPLAFMVDDNLSDAWNTTAVNPADNWNSLAHALGINGDLFVAQNNIQNNATATVNVTLDQTGYVYLYVDKSGPNKVKVTYDSFSKEYSYINRGYFIALESVDAYTTLTVTNTDDSKSGQGINLSAYVLDEKVLSQMYDILNREPLTIDHYDSTSVSGTVTTKDGGIMFTSIPYDTGWTVYVDGTPTETYSYEEAFLSFPVTAGTHTIRLEYTPNGFWAGLLVSLISLILLGMIRLLIRQWKLNHEQAAATGIPEELEDDEALPEETEDSEPAPDPQDEIGCSRPLREPAPPLEESGETGIPEDDAVIPMEEDETLPKQTGRTSVPLSVFRRKKH